jgi:transcriptional regulator with XRE-family HTH domain
VDGSLENGRKSKEQRRLAGEIFFTHIHLATESTFTIMFQGPSMEATSKASPVSKRDIFYYRQRMKNRVFTELASFFATEAAQNHLTKREIANRLQCDPSLVTRWLSAPGNVTLETISDLLLALDAEMDVKAVRFKDRAKPNYAHSLIVELAAAPQIERTAKRHRFVKNQEVKYNKEKEPIESPSILVSTGSPTQTVNITVLQPE